MLCTQNKYCTEFGVNMGQKTKIYNYTFGWHKYTDSCKKYTIIHMVHKNIQLYTWVTKLYNFTLGWQNIQLYVQVTKIYNYTNIHLADINMQQYTQLSKIYNYTYGL